MTRKFYVFLQFFLFALVFDGLLASSNPSFDEVCKNYGGKSRRKGSLEFCDITTKVDGSLKNKPLSEVCTQLFPFGIDQGDASYDRSSKKLTCSYLGTKCTKFDSRPVDGECYKEFIVERRNITYSRDYEFAPTCPQGYQNVSKEEFDKKRLGKYYSSSYVALRTQLTRLHCRMLLTPEDILRRDELNQRQSVEKTFGPIFYPVYNGSNSAYLYMIDNFIENEWSYNENCHFAAKIYGMRGQAFSDPNLAMYEFPSKIKEFHYALTSFWYTGLDGELMTNHYALPRSYDFVSGVSNKVVLSLEKRYLNTMYKFFTVREHRQFPLLCEFYSKADDDNKVCENSQEWHRGAHKEHLHPRRCITLEKSNQFLYHYDRQVCFANGMTIIAPANQKEMDELMKLAGDDVVAVDGLLDVECYDSDKSEDCQFEVMDESTNQEEFRQFLSKNWAPGQPNLKPYTVEGEDAEYKRDCLLVHKGKFYTESCYRDIQRKESQKVLCAKEPIHKNN